MRPEKLTITAFGPFKDTVVVDFTSLGKDGLYLITGATGSGKTTLFDALSYALYGVTTSQNFRDAEQMRSHYSKGDAVTSVELIFKEKGKSYRIKRIPAQKRPKKRGDGFVEEAASAELNLPDGKTLTKKDQINEKIEELIGMTAEQFSQIVMLAQGQFSRFLVSKTEEKSALFKKLFNTDNYGLLQEALQQKAKEAEEAYKSIRIGQSTLISSIDVDDDSKWKDRLDEIKESKILPPDFDVIINGIEKELSEQNEKASSAFDICTAEETSLMSQIDKFNEKSALTKKLTIKECELTEVEYELEKASDEVQLNTERQKKKDSNLVEITHLTSLLHKYEELESSRKNANEKREFIDEKNHELISLKNSIDETKAGLEKLMAEHSELEGIQKKLDNATEEDYCISNRLSTLDEIRKKVEDISRKQEDLEQIRISLAEMKKKKESLEKEIKDHEKQKNEIEAVLVSLKDADNNALAIRRHVETVNALKSDYDSILIYKNQLDELEKKITECANELSRAKSTHLDILDSIYLSGAASYAGNLEEGKPCPVCGSLHHPSPAVSDGKSYTQEDLAEAKRAENEADERFRTTEKEKSQIIGIIETIKSNIERLRNTLPVELKEMQIDEIVSLMAVKEEEAESDIEKKEVLTSRLNSLISQLGEMIEKLNIQKDCIRSDEYGEKIYVEYLEKLKKETESEAKKASISLEELDDSLKKLREEKETSENLLITIRKEKERDAEIAKKIEELRDVLQEKEEKNNRLSLEITVQIEQLNAEVKMMERLSSELSYKNKSEVEEMISGLKKANIELDDLIKKSSDEYGKTSVLKSSLMSVINHLREQIALIPDYDISELSKRKDEVEKRKEDLDSKRVDCKAKLKSIIDAKSRYEKSESESSILREKWAMFKELSDVASGKMSGENKLTLETFVQIRYLNRILQKANEKLLRMSNGQYEMERCENARNKSQKMGLDIDVMDHFTGKKRPASTLSGGEIFKASLSLALGLSEVIQMNSGAVRIETMFVDEGFGTLDEDSLHSAVNTLSSLASKGRLVGVISHVQELKDRIEKQIVVEKTNTGSTVKMRF